MPVQHVMENPRDRELHIAYWPARLGCTESGFAQGASHSVGIGQRRPTRCRTKNTVLFRATHEQQRATHLAWRTAKHPHSHLHVSSGLHTWPVSSATRALPVQMEGEMTASAVMRWPFKAAAPASNTIYPWAKVKPDMCSVNG